MELTFHQPSAKALENPTTDESELGLAENVQISFGIFGE
jgi:hypothetical protein